MADKNRKKKFTARDAFMGRIRAALGNTGADSGCYNNAGEVQLTAAEESLIRLVNHSKTDQDPAEGVEGLIELFIAGAERVGVVVQRVRFDGVGEVVEGLLGSVGGRAVAIDICDDELNKIAGKVAAESAGWGIFGSGGQADCVIMGDYDDGVDIGITDVNAAIAETGTLVLDFSNDSRGTKRSCTVFMPLVHIALVKASQLVGDLLDYLRVAEMRCVDKDSVLNGGLSRNNNNMMKNTVLITGPSKTADIEGVLVQGMHGPGELYVVMIEDM